jgi:serine/threonine-protein kinase
VGFDPERLSDVVRRALEQEPARRAAFLDETCADDPDLRAEVESLLAAHEQASGLLDTASHGFAAVEPKGTSDESLVGRSLGQYRVIKRLGQGGMGVVYLADDTRLGRRVAIKALARQSTQDDQRRNRLRREARAAAALSHPGIATVYALEEFDGNLYIVCEYVPGGTLREELADGPLPLDSLLNTCVEIARALTAAHANGVVHRDLKPENVMRTEDGGIKILDFGLARFQGSQRPAVASATRLTEPGTTLGTPGYMSPEQLLGSEVDFRADVFSFGVLVFELASGVHPFSGSSVTSMIARVLETEPADLAQLSRSCPGQSHLILRAHDDAE